MTEPGDAPSGTALTIDNTGTISGGGERPLCLGGSVTGDTSVNTGNASGLTLVNTGALSLGTGAAGAYNYDIFRIWAQQTASGPGSTTAAAAVFNENTITIAPGSGIQVIGATGIRGSDQGGPTFGNSYGASVYNGAALTLTATGQQGAAGIQAFSTRAYQGTASAFQGSAALSPSSARCP